MIFALEAEPAEPVRTDGPSQAGGDWTALSAEQELELARRYAPRVWLHPREQYGPLDPAAFVGASLLGWRLRRRFARVEPRGRLRLQPPARRARPARSVTLTRPDE